MHLTKFAIVHREPEAAAVHCARLTNLHHLKPSQNFMICDAGGGTVVRICVVMGFRTILNCFAQDLAVYKILGELQGLEIAEVCARSGANCGSIFLSVLTQQQWPPGLTLAPGIYDSSSSFGGFSLITLSTLILQALNTS